MKMTLNQLKVESYSSQVSESELTEIKGGTWSICVRAAAKILAAAAAVNELIEQRQAYCDNGGSGCGVPPGTDLGGSRPFE